MDFTPSSTYDACRLRSSSPPQFLATWRSTRVAATWRWHSAGNAAGFGRCCDALNGELAWQREPL